MSLLIMSPNTLINTNKVVTIPTTTTTTTTSSSSTSSIVQSLNTNTNSSTNIQQQQQQQQQDQQQPSTSTQTSTTTTTTTTTTPFDIQNITYESLIDLFKYSQREYNYKQIRDLFNKFYYVSNNKIGTGGFGVIFSGIRRKDNLPIAVKVIKKSKVTQWYNLCDGKRIPLEIALMLRVKNVKNCIKIIDYMEQQNCFVIVMERLESYKDLFDYITEKGALDEDLVKDYFKQIIHTIHEIHKLGVIHRDIKDENILVDLKTGQLKLIDFGAGTFYTNKNILFTDFQGTRVYSPPEWITKQCYYGDKATVWSLGILLYNMLYGDIPWEEDDDIINVRFTNAKKHPLHHNNDIYHSPDVDDLIRKCLVINDIERIRLDDILNHKWFHNNTTPTNNNNNNNSTNNNQQQQQQQQQTTNLNNSNNESSCNSCNNSRLLNRDNCDNNNEITTLNNVDTVTTTTTTTTQSQQDINNNNFNITNHNHNDCNTNNSSNNNNNNKQLINNLPQLTLNNDKNI